ncbi:hypothetical protein DMI72_07445 [Akkermansia muciniphila]|nr:hypothetical protein DMI71_07345 [Akkermansia muciniphila]QHV56037.1 hypothetical protein DMI72_07445 [Akkermansia muciniphila]QHV58409.1 hypothetical protein DMI73_07380 [Akkermansia muciniphila]QHV59598.1 hypothetical protein DMI74_00765 [Akkermansia muciniphila]
MPWPCIPERSMQQFSVVWGKAGASAGAEAPIFSEACLLFHGRAFWRRFSSLSHSAFEAGNLPVRRHFGGCSVRLPGNGRSGCRAFGDECSG